MNAAPALTLPAFDEWDERRGDARLLSVLRVGRALWDGRDQLCVVRNISSGGLMFECLHPPATGQGVIVELRSDKQMIGVVRWVRGGGAGVEFDRPIDVEQILREERGALLRVRPRAPRFVREGQMRLIGEGEPVSAAIVDIAIGGLSCRADAPVRKGDPVVAAIDGIPAVNAEIRWIKGDVAGLRFEKPLPWRALQLWLDTAPG